MDGTYDESSTLLPIRLWEHEHGVQDLDACLRVDIDTSLFWSSVGGIIRRSVTRSIKYNESKFKKGVKMMLKKGGRMDEGVQKAKSNDWLAQVQSRCRLVRRHICRGSGRGSMTTMQYKQPLSK